LVILEESPHRCSRCADRIWLERPYRASAMTRRIRGVLRRVPESIRTWLSATSMLLALSGPLLMHRLIAGRTAVDGAAPMEARPSFGWNAAPRPEPENEIVWHGRLCVAADLLLLAGSQLVQLIPDGTARLFACLKGSSAPDLSRDGCRPGTTEEAVTGRRTTIESDSGTAGEACRPGPRFANPS
jgi:hypothetical protein